MMLHEPTITFASPHGDIADPKTWSATPARILEHVGRHFSQTQTLNYRLGKRADFAMRVASRLFKGWNCSRNGAFNGMYERRFRSGWQALPVKPDACLHISDFCVPPGLPGQARHFIYTDSTLVRLAKHLPQHISSGFLKKYSALSRCYLERIDTVFTLNEWTRESFIKDHGFPAERIINARFGINISPYTGPKDFSRRLMLIVLRPKLETIKGLDLLLAALPEVRRKLPDVELAVVGTELNPCPPGVTCYYNQPREKTIELMRAATLFAMPALCEPNGIVYPEALASQTPILGLNRFAVPEFTDHGRYGFIADEPQPAAIARAILHAFQSPQRLAEMAAAGQKFVAANYSWSKTGELMAQIIKARLTQPNQT